MCKRCRQLHRYSRGEAQATLVVEYGERIHSQDQHCRPQRLLITDSPPNRKNRSVALCMSHNERPVAL